METKTTTRLVWVIRPAFAMNRPPVEVGPEDDLADLVERAMDASPTSEVMITQEVRNGRS